MVLLSRQSRKVKKCSAQPAESGCVPSGTFSSPVPRSARAPATSVLSAVVPTQHSNGTLPVESLVPLVSDSFISASPLPALPWHDFSDTKTYRIPFANTPVHFLEIYDRIITPYNAPAFAIELSRCDLWDRYPFLLGYICNGFPLGHMPTLGETIIIPNHSSVAKHPNVVWDYILEEATSGRMSGAFSKEEMEIIMRGPFFASPFIVSEQTQGPDKPLKYRVCRNLSKDGRDSLGNIMPCINSYIFKEYFPTAFDSAAHMADLVSFIYSFRAH